MGANSSPQLPALRRALGNGCLVRGPHVVETGPTNHIRHDLDRALAAWSNARREWCAIAFGRSERAVARRDSELQWDRTLAHGYSAKNRYRSRDAERPKR